MNQTINPVARVSSSALIGTLAIMGFSAESNLRDVAQALGKKDIDGLSRALEKNAKLSRLRAEIQEQIATEKSRSTVTAREHQKLVLISQASLMFERMGIQTLEMANLCVQIIREPRPSRVAELKKLIEHAVYITDRVATSLIQYDIEIAQIAIEQKRTATELNGRIHRELASLIEAGGDAAVRAGLLGRIANKAQEIIEEAGQLAQELLIFLEGPEF